MTSIQKLLGHHRLNSTMTYARVHDRTVADDYYRAMQQVETVVNFAPESEARVPDEPHLIALVDLIGTGPLTAPQEQALQTLRTMILRLVPT